MSCTIKHTFSLASLVIVFLAFSPEASAQLSVRTRTAVPPDGVTSLIEVPANWNGALLLYLHGFVTPDSPNPAKDVGDPVTRLFMLSSGFALAGSSCATTGWTIP
jgi:hypothetical protein